MTQAKDYKDTVFLPKTDFPMKASLPAKEPGIAARWEQDGLYRQLRAARGGAEKFILHDGPPYANGDIHIGHALNHVLKDMVCRTQNLLGKDAPYVPGWDCHGLPIEWKVEEQYRKKKKNKDEVPAKEFRAECRAYAQKWVDAQREELKRLGIMGDWDHPYLTMDPEAEGTIVAELMKFAQSGNLYRGSKPVMWSPVEKTALAEAEVEYEDIVSTQVDVGFEITECPNVPELVGAQAVIWTTTPWTIPLNQAIAYGEDVEYVVFTICADANSADAADLVGENPSLDLLADDKKIVIAKHLIDAFSQRLDAYLKAASDGAFQLTDFDFGDAEYDLAKAKVIKGSELAGTKARHPMHHLGGFFATPRPFLAGDFVTTESGTGLVHMAPDHGEDDFALCKANGINPQFAVMDDGRYRDDWPWLGGDDRDEEGKPRRRAVINKGFNSPEGPICSDLRDAGALLAASEDYSHSYPHSWRSKAKVIFRCTPQWFVPMDKPLPVTPAKAGVSSDNANPPEIPACAGMTLREIATKEIERVRFVPEKGKNRIGAMVETRPDWVLSRQRAWGVPITLFVRSDGSYLQDAGVNARIVAAIRADGVDAWDEARKAEFLGDEHDPQEFEMVTDILDVWFDSGSTHAFVLESGRWPDLRWPADLYLEGSDQHRGWFQSSLLESCATRGRAPYDQVLTHGFTMDQAGKKMSKSLGNTVDPLKVMERYGADIIRLWALSVDFTEDHRIGDEILKGVADQYRKLRNTFRYLLGALGGFEESERVDLDQMPELERYILSLLGDLDLRLRKAANDYDFNSYTRALSDFANEDLSAFFFDIRKDCLYCDAPSSIKRRAYRHVLDILFEALVRYLAPVLVFTAEEVWQSRYGDAQSVHLNIWPEVPDIKVDRSPWDKLRALRETVNEAIEPLRREKIIRSSLEAEVTIPAEAVPEGFSATELAELFITATVKTSDSGEVEVTKTKAHKCGRCWRHLPEIEADGALCARCTEVIATIETAGETAGETAE